MRKAVAMLIMLVFLAFWTVAAATIGSQMTDWPDLAQLAFYIAAGVGWALPLKPLMMWMNATERSED